ncbi:MAG: hypothetical protein AB7H90_08605 [Alphaproteobacteria bacterium]
MTKQSDGPTQISRVLTERLQDNDKERAIELYYELLSAGHSVGEILNGAGPVRGKTALANTAAAEDRQAAPDREAIARISEVASATAPGGSGDTEERRGGEPRVARNAPPDEPEPDNREPPPRAGLPGAQPEIAGLSASDREAARDAGDRERFRSGWFPGGRRVAFAALGAAAIISVSVAGFSIVSGDRGAEPAIIRAEAPISGGSGTAAAALPGAASDRSDTVAETVASEQPVASAAASQATEASRPGEPVAAVPRPLQPIPVGVRETVAAAPQRSDAGQPGAVPGMSEAATAAEAPRDAMPAAIPSAAPSLSLIAPSVIATEASDAAHSDAERRERGGLTEAAPKDEAGAAATVVPATGPTRNASAPPPSGAQNPRRRAAGARRPSAEARRHVRRRAPARSPQPVYYGQSPGPGYAGWRAGSSYADPARGYGYGAYGPAPYSDTGD